MPYDEAWLIARMLANPDLAIAQGSLTPVLRAKAPEKDLGDTPRYASKTEARYALLLETRQACQEIERWWYEGIKLQLAPNTFYTPDFLVQSRDQSLELHEVKGWWREDARVKIKVAAEHYPCFRFLAAIWKNGTWKYETFRQK